MLGRRGERWDKGLAMDSFSHPGDAHINLEQAHFSKSSPLKIPRNQGVLATWRLPDVGKNWLTGNVNPLCNL